MPTAILDRDPRARLPFFEPTTRAMDAEELAEYQDWGLKGANIPEAWKLTRGKSTKKGPVKVAILDTGVDTKHQDLVDRLKKAKDFTGSVYGPEDKNSHGTHCSGIMCASDNGKGIVGVAPEADLYIYKVLGDDGSGAGSGIVRGIDEAVADGCNVLSMSLGSPQPDQRILAALKRATDAGRIVIVAAGNDGMDNSVGYPARSQYACAVASYNKRGEISDYSSRGPEVDIAAPGEDIMSCLPGNKYGGMSGTSMATPFIAGVAALALAREWDIDNVEFPIEVPGDAQNNYDRMITRFGKYAIDYGPQGRDPLSGWGFVDPQKMIESMRGRVIVPPPAPPSAIVWGPITLNGVVGEWVFRPGQVA